MTTAPLFGLLILDRDPLRYADLPGLVQAWLMDAGGFAALGLAVYLLYALMTPAEQAASAKSRIAVTGWMLAMAVLAVLAYSVYAFLLFSNRGGDTEPQKVYSAIGYFKFDPPKFNKYPQALALTFGGLFALLGIGQPFAAGLARIKFRRIWALTRLAFKEAVQNKLFLLFLVFLIPVLFPISWFYQGKPEDELRNTIWVTSFATAVLTLLPAALLAAFSIPNDVKNQNIYTIVTKPVERFEIVAGRFFGYTALMTVVLVGMTAGSWLLIASTKLSENARQETYMARMPVYGQLDFASKKGKIDGTNVGREFDYRQYIGGHPQTSQRAVWRFETIPSSLYRNRTDDAVPLEFTFDIFRLTKGLENRGVDVEVQIVTGNTLLVPPSVETDGEWKWVDPAKKVEYTKKAVAKLGLESDPIVQGWVRNNNWDEVYKQRVRPLARGAQPGDKNWPAVNELAAEFGFYETAGVEVFDYHPEQIMVPAGLFRNAETLGQGSDPNRQLPKVVATVKCSTPGQMLGMAAPDLYFLENEPRPSAALFAQNYFKAAFGLWCRVALVIGLAVCCSTYLTGVIAFLVTAFLFLSGFFSEHIADMATGKSYAGGPFQGMMQLMEAKQLNAPLDETNPLTWVAGGGDRTFSWLIRRFINVVPDVDAFSWTGFVSEGFNVPVEYLAMNLIVLAAYLLPWFILGFYLMRSREVAA